MVAFPLSSPALVRGALEGLAEDLIILHLPESEYRLHLCVSPAAAATLPAAGSAIYGRVHARARRVDVVRAGGAFIEPVYGRPRHVQGRVLAVDAGANTLVVQSACLVSCALMPGQQARDFAPGQLVAFDAEPGTEFLPDQPTFAPLRRPATELSDDHGDPLPFGHAPTEEPGPAIHRPPSTPAVPDTGALGTSRQITGMEGSPAGFPIDGQ